MQNKFTPGPWDLQLIESDTGRIRHLCPMDDDGLSLLTVVEHNGKKFAAVYKDEDARLIAAAPELLEALRGVIRVADRATVEFDAARAAIAKAKATGGQS